MDDVPERFALYMKHEGEMHGWFNTGCLKLFDAVDRVQRALGVKGHIGEIGVYTGRSFIPLCLLASEDERAVGIDCFDAQEWNTSGSGYTPGKNSMEEFERNAGKVLDSMEHVVVKRADARRTDASDYMQWSGGLYRIWHIDGGHSYHETTHDLIACFATLCKSGVVFVDDVFNKEWPEVARAMYAYLGEVDFAAPLAFGYGKAVLCLRPDHDQLRARLADALRPSTTAQSCGVNALVY